MFILQLIDTVLSAFLAYDLRRRRQRRDAEPTARASHDGGQATAEYALVLLGAAIVAIALITWATGSGRIGELFDAVFDEIRSRL
ncbi:MAG: hypothetical protein GXY13_11090 [Acidimicrobiales bacterium]|nr:hypothetical protein [Acidimicrobiales bacterium]